MVFDNVKYCRLGGISVIKVFLLYVNNIINLFIFNITDIYNRLN